METHTQALERNYDSLVRQQTRERPHKELFELLKSMSDTKALEIFHWIKAGHDVQAILNHAKDGNLLL
jgi:hypothetical protein